MAGDSQVPQQMNRGGRQVGIPPAGSHRLPDASQDFLPLLLKSSLRTRFHSPPA